MGTARIQVHVEDASGVTGVPSTADFVRWAQAALAGRRSEGALAIRVVGEAESAELNGRYRKKSGATNVLSFPAELPPGMPPLTIGDLVICAPVVRREAQEQGKPLDVHWAHMVVHGCLHLLGFDHEDETAAAEMEPLEADILRQMGYPDPYAPR
jgi:probable rRNA maturation factor